MYKKMTRAYYLNGNCNTMTVFTKLTFDEVRSLPIVEKLEYMKQVNAIRQKKYRDNNKEKLKEKSRGYAKTYKEKNTEKYKEIARKNSKKYRDKMKEIRMDLERLRNPDQNVERRLTGYNSC